MKTVLALFVLGVAITIGSSENPSWSTYKDLAVDDSSSLVPQEDGTFRLMTHEEARQEYENSPKPRSELVVYFLLYTRKTINAPELVELNDSSSLKKSGFNPKNPTKILVHGWRASANSPMNQILVPNFLRAGNYNIFVVDWSSTANTVNYFSARYSVIDVAAVLAKFIDFLHSAGKMQFKDLTFVGHSLGAHASGIAAKKPHKGRVQNIIGLDPARPLFSMNASEDRLDPHDAVYVQTIQTNAGFLGFHQPLGQATFYPNWGTYQAGCGIDPMGNCAHSRAYQFYSESLGKNNSFIPYDCTSYMWFKMKRCYKPNLEIRMGGEPSDYGYVKGVYYLPTNVHSPYGVGTHSP